MLRPSIFTLSVVLSACVLVADTLVLALRPFSVTTVAGISDVFDVAGPLIIVVFWAMQLYHMLRRRDWRHGRLFWAQLMLGLAVTSDIVAQLGWAINEDVLHVSPFPSWTDGFYLAFYVFVFAAIFLLPTRRSSALSRLQLVIDGLSVATAASIFSWYFLIGPIVFDKSASLVSIVVASLYPVFDLVLLMCLVVVWIRSDEPRLRRVIALLTASIAIVVFADSVFQYQDLTGGYAAGSVLDALWVAADLLCGLAALALAIDLRWDRVSDATRTHDAIVYPGSGLRYWLEYLPYLALPPVLGFFLTLWNTPADGDDYLEPGVLFGCVVFTGLIIVRQLLAIRENQRLHRAVRDDALRLAEVNQQLVEINQNLEEANSRLESLATTDPLTSLLNHRAINGSIDQEIERAFRYGRQFSLLFIDLDHFKTINDTYGHGAGDVALKDFAEMVTRNVRGVDVVGRWGGEEFLVLLPEIDGTSAIECAERVRASIAGHRFPVGGGIHITCSVGVASYPQNSMERGELIDLADQAMYAAKRLGRNQVRSSGEEAVVALARANGVRDSRHDATLVGVVQALAALVEARDRYTGRHMSEVGHRVVRLALRTGMSPDEAQMLGVAGLLHDIGKVGVPDAILQKPTHLSEKEWTVLRTHTGIGADVVSRVPPLRPLAPIIRAHHERWDGTGYPDGLAGAAIPFGARILAVVDAYGAMTSNRPYRLGHTAEWARTELRHCAGTQFDPVVVESFLELLESEDLTAIDASDLFAVSN